MRTRVGYAGGRKANPTYYSMGDHTECFQVDYDPSVIAYADLVKLFLKSGSHSRKPWSDQYKSILFYHDEEQERVARELVDPALYLELRPAVVFYEAEDYHQKYYLRQSALEREFLAMYPELRDFVDSTAAARVNGYVSGYGKGDQLTRELPLLGLSEKSQAELKRRAAQRGFRCGD